MTNLVTNEATYEKAEIEGIAKTKSKNRQKEIQV